MNNIILNSFNSKLLSENSREVYCETIKAHLINILKLTSERAKELNVVVEGVGFSKGVFKMTKEGKIQVKFDQGFSKGRKRRVHLVIASTRPLMAKRILEHGTTLGAASFNFFPAELSEKSYLSAKIYDQSNANEFIRKGMAQCNQFCTLPEFQIFRDLTEVIVKFKNDNIRRVWLDHKANSIFSLEHTKEDIAIFIGPERGWSNFEKDYFRENEINGVKLSDSVMRVEFAVNAAFSQLEYISNSGINV